jgi:capsular exopolysaccharide synthesis family protein
VDLRDYVRVLRKRWRLIAICTLLAIGAAAAVTWQTTPKYQASTQLFVAARDTSSNVGNLAAGGQFTQARVQSYANIVNSPQVADAVATQLHAGLTGRQIAKEITATAPLNTVLVNVSVNDTSPQRAQAIANAVSDQFATFAANLETTPGSASSPVKVTVVKRAELPLSPVSPRKKLNLILGLLVGLAIGVGGAVLRETLDTTVKDPEQVQREMGLPMLGAIAYDPDATKRPLIVHADPRSSRSEAFRQLRTNLQFVNIDRAPRSLVISSSVPEEGKTTTATNLAIALAQSGMRVLLVEADLRRPRMADYLGIEGAVGLTSVLIGRAELADAVQHWGDDSARLDVLPSGPTPPNPSELLGSKGMAELLRELELTYDLVLIDAPPLLPVTDAAVLANVASGAVVIVRYGHTRREQLARAVESLRSVGAEVFGVVLTMTPTRGPDSYYYGYGYRYDRPASRRGKLELVTPVARGSRSSDPPATAATTTLAGTAPDAPTQPSGPASAAPPDYSASPDHLGDRAPDRPQPLPEPAPAGVSYGGPSSSPLAPQVRPAEPGHPPAGVADDPLRYFQD